MTLTRTGKVNLSRSIDSGQTLLSFMPLTILSKVAGLLICAILVLWAAYTLVSQYLLPINTLYVTGNIENIDEVTLKQAAQNAIKRGFFAVDVNAVKDTVHKLPWVQNVSVRRIWPDGLHVHIKEHIPVARWGSGKLINEMGELFSPIQQPEGMALPILLGAEETETFLFRQYLDLTVGLKSAGLSVKEIVYDERHSMRVTLNNDIVLLFGRVQSIASNKSELLRFAEAYRSTLAKQENNIVGIDLRYPNGFAVHWKSTVSSELNNNHNKLRT